MVKAGDILKFAEPLHWWDKEILQKGGKYIVEKVPQAEFYQTPDGWWHSKDTGKTELHLRLKLKNGGFGYGKIAQYADRNFEVIGNIFENKKAEN